MKILLIKPYWRVVKYVICPPLGILSLASYLRRQMNPAPEVIVLDQAANQLSLTRVEELIKKERPDIIGITALTYETPGAKVIINLSKKVLPDTPVVVGGPHASFFYDHLLKDTLTDIAVIGEGEETFLELVTRIRDGHDWRDVLGIAYRAENDQIVKNPPRPPIMDLDSLPYPAWDLVDIPIYSKYGDMNGVLAAWPYMFIFTSRACPYNCIYCHKIFGKRFRARSAESVLEEIRRLVMDHGVRELHVIDDIFNLDLDRAKEICRGIISKGIKVKIAFPNGIRGDRLDGELIELLARAGCYSMTFAVETVSLRLQKTIRKFLDLDKTTWAINKAYDEGILPVGFFMLGFPGETREEMEETIRFASRSNLLRAFFFSVVPFPRTQLFDLFRETYHDKFNLNEYDLENMHYSTPDSFYRKVTGIDLSEVVRSAYRRFYLDPLRVARILIRFPWNRRLLRGFYLGFLATLSGGRLIDEWMAQYGRRRLGMDS